MILYGKLLLWVILCTIIFNAFGYLLSFGKKIFISNISNFAFRQVLGSIAFVSIYANIFSGFKTVFVLVLPIIVAILVYFWKSNAEKKKIFSFSRLELAYFFALLIFSTFVSYLIIRGDLHSGLKVPIKDQAFYSTLAKSISLHYNESFIELLGAYSIESALYPYHYYELWMSSALIKYFHLNSFFAQTGVTYTHSIFITLCLVVGSFDIKSISKANLLFVFLFCTAFLFQRSWLTFLYPDEMYFESIFYDGHYKFVHLVPCFIVSFLLLKDGHRVLAFLFFLMLPSINTITIPWVAISFALLILTSFFIDKNQIYNKQNIWFFIVLCIYLIVGVYYIGLLQSESNSSFIKSIGGIFYNVTSNGLKWLFANIVLIIALILIYRKNKNSVTLFLYVFLLIVFCSSILSRALLDTNQNSFQIFQSASYLLGFSMVLVLSNFLAESRLLSKFFFLIPFILYALFLQNYNSISHVFKTNISKYDTTYVEEIGELELENNKGLKIVNASKLRNLMKNPIYAGFNEYFVFNKNLSCALVINTDQLLPEKMDSSLQANSLRNEFLPLCYFNILADTEPFEKDSFKKSVALTRFLIKEKPTYLIVDNGCNVPIEFKPYLGFYIIDKNSKEAFYYLQY